MNRWIPLLAALLIFGSTKQSWADQKAALGNPPKSPSNARSSQPVSQRSPFNHQIRDLKRKIKLEIKKGKLTKDQAGELLKKIKEIHRQSLQTLSQNPDKKLTPDQENHFNQQLEEINSTL